ncbi:MAG: phage tail tape measure protein [Filifactoraceae bacterium]
MAIEEKRIRAVFETDTSKYNQSLDGINNKMKVTQSELKAVNTDIKNFGNNTEKSAQKQKLLREAIDQNNSKMKLYEDAIKKTNTKIDEGVKKRNELQKAIDQNKKKLDEIIKSEGKSSESAKALKEEIKRLETEYKSNERSIQQNIKSTGSYQTQVNKAKVEVNNLEKELQQSGNALEVQGKKMDATGDKADKLGDRLKGIGGGLSSAGDKVLGASLAMATGIGVAVNQFMEFEHGIMKVTTVADESILSFDKVKEGIVGLSNDLGVGVEELNAALYETLSAGVASGDAVDFLGKAVKLAKGGFTDTTTAVDLLTTVINSYGMEAKDATKIMDILINTQNKGKTTVGELGDSMGKVIPVAKNSNLSLEQLATAYSLMTSKGIKTAETTTYITSMLNELSKSGTDVSDVLKKKTGKSFQELLADGKPLSEILGVLDEHAKENSLSMADLFGSSEAARAAMVLYTDDGKAYNSMMKDVAGTTGSAQKAFDKMAQTSKEKVNKQMNELKNNFMKLGEAALPVLEEITDLVGEFADWLGSLSDEQMEQIINWTKYGLVIGGTMKILGGTMNTLGSISNGLGSITKLFGSTTSAATTTASSVATTTGAISTLGGAAGIALGVVAPLGIALGAIGMIGWTVSENLTKDCVPAIDLFATHVETASDGTVTHLQTISEETKVAVGAYMKFSDEASGALVSLSTTSGKTTEQITTDINNTKTKFDTLAKETTRLISEEKGKMIENITNMHVTSASFTEETYKEIVGKLNTQMTDEQKIVAENQQIISDTLIQIQNQQGGATTEQLATLATAQQTITSLGISAASEYETEANVITGRLKDNTVRVTAEQVGEQVKHLEEGRIKAVDAANREYEERIKIAEELKKDGTAESIKLADEIIAQAERQRKGAVEKANGIKEKGIDELSKSYAGLRDDINLQTGEILGWWDKLMNTWDSWFPSKKTFEVDYLAPALSPDYSASRPMYPEGSGFNRSAGPRSVTPRTMATPYSVENVNLEALAPKALPRSAPLRVENVNNTTPFNYNKLEKIAGDLLKGIQAINQDVVVNIDPKKITDSSDRELARRATINKFGSREG